MMNTDPSFAVSPVNEANAFDAILSPYCVPPFANDESIKRRMLDFRATAAAVLNADVGAVSTEIRFAYGHMYFRVSVALAKGRYSSGEGETEELAIIALQKDAAQMEASK